RRTAFCARQARFRSHAWPGSSSAPRVRASPVGRPASGVESIGHAASASRRAVPAGPGCGDGPYPWRMVEPLPHAVSQPPPATGTPPLALVFGGSGQIGRPLLARLSAAGWTVLAISRQPQPALPGLRWQRGELAAPGVLPARLDAIFS